MHSPTIKHRGAFVATLLTGTFSMSISQSSLSTAYPAFMKAFGLGADTVAWLTTGFMLVMTLMIPVSPWLLQMLLSNGFSKRLNSFLPLGQAYVYGHRVLPCS